MYVKRLVIRNFRCFGDTEIELNYTGRRATKHRPVPSRLKNVNLLLGGNGSGKSSVFKALALGVLAPIIRNSGFQAEYLVQRKPGSSLSAPVGNGPVKENAEIRAYLELHDEDASGIPAQPHTIVGQAVIERTGDFEDIVSTAHNNPDLWERIFYNDSAAFFLVGYGASRRTERPEGYSESSRSPRYQRVANLFEEHVGLSPFQYGYLQLKDLGFLDEARAILNTLLPDDVRLTEQTDGRKQLLFDHAGVLLPFSALSDGYRAFVGWVWDLLLQMGKVRPPGRSRVCEFTRLRGVVIVDEIDLFLHPGWQRVVIEQVAGTFPRLQFLFSSHSPLIAGGLEAANIFVPEDGKVTQYAEDVYGLTANQVLTSSYFGLRSTRAPLTGTLDVSANRSLGLEPKNEEIYDAQAEPNDAALDAKERVRRMREGLGAA